MNYRTAGIDDIEALIKMRITYLIEDYGSLTEEQLSSLGRQLPQYFEEHLGQDLIVFVAEENGRIVSTDFLLIQSKPANPSFMTGKTGTILNVITDVGHRRQGIAGRLMRMAIDEADHHDLSYLELKSTDMGKSLYESLGFEQQISSYTPMIYKFKK